MGLQDISADAQKLIKSLMSAVDYGNKGNRNGEIDTKREEKELQTLLGTALSNGTLSAEDYSAYTNNSKPSGNVDAFVPENSGNNKVKNSSEQGVTNPQQQKRQNKIDAQVRADETKDYIKKLTDNKVPLSDMLNMWELKSNLGTNHAEEKQEIQALITAMGDYGTKDAIKNLDRTVRKKLGSNMTDLQRKVLADMIKLADYENMTKKAKEFCNKYEEVRNQHVTDGKKMTYTEYYNETVRQVSGEQNGGADYLSEAALMLMEYIKKNDAHDIYISELQAIRKEGKLTDPDDITKTLNTKYADDKIMLDVIKENEHIYRNNVKEGPHHPVARGNKSDKRQEELSHITRNDLKELAKANRTLESKLWNYISRDSNKNNDGTYNMNKLYDIVNRRSGGNNFTDKTKYTLLSEYQHILEYMDLEGLHIDKNELKTLLEFMGRDYAKNTHYVKDAINPKDVAQDGVNGFVAALPTVCKDVTNVAVDVNITGLSATAVNALTSAVTEAGGSVTNGVLNTLHIFVSDTSWASLLNLATVPVATILLNVLEKLVIGQPNEENPCTNLTNDQSAIKEECGDDPEKLKQYIAERHTERAANMLSKLIDIYTAKNKKEFTTDGFITYISKLGGSGSLVNCQELTGGLLEEGAIIEQPDDNNNGDDQHKISKGDIQPQGGKTEETVDVRKSSWSKIAEQYDCLLNDNRLGSTVEARKAKVVRMIKIAQGITDGNYSFERLYSLMQLSYRKNWGAMKKEQGFDFNTFNSFLKASLLTEVKLPANFAGCDRNDNNLTAPRYKGTPGTITPAAPKLFTTAGTPGKYGLRLDDKPIEKYNNQSERDNKYNQYVTEFDISKDNQSQFTPEEQQELSKIKL